jgi:type I restriction enzyme S subunit
MRDDSWPEFRLRDLGEVFTGRTPSTEHPAYFGDDYPFITPSDMHQGKYARTTQRGVSHEGAELLKRVKLPANSVCVSCIGWQMGEAIMTDKPSFTNQQINAIVPNSKVDPSFLYYSLLPRKQELLSMGATIGARTPILKKSAFSDLKVKIPTLPVQRRIAGILSAYDELMENSQQRMRILEEIARTIYREWFVHFRFPGHEKLPRAVATLGDIPQGWEISRLGDHLSALDTGKRPKGGATSSEGGVPSIGAENISGIGNHSYAAEKFVPRDFFTQMRRGLVQNRDVALYKDGAYIGRSSYFRDGFPHIECCVNEHVFLLRSSGKRLTQNALYLWLREPDTVHAIRATNSNAAQPGINQQGINGLKIVVPTASLASRFDETVEPLLAQIVNLAKRNQNLRRTRDLLLPKLMSGEIDVSQLASEPATLVA